MDRYDTNSKILVAGGGGFIGGWLIRRLLELGFKNIVSADIKDLANWHQVFNEVDNRVLDLANLENCYTATKGVDLIFNLAADMGGMGFIENNKALCMISVLINTHLLMAAKERGINDYFYASSACVYAADKQTITDLRPLKEEYAYPAMPEDGYGWEKLFSERMCRHFREDFGIRTRVVRFHNVYGPNGCYDNGREKAPAAICRKVALSKIFNKHEIEVWGDGEQTRSFMYIDDCVTGILKIMNSDFFEPINLGSSEMVSINELVAITEQVAKIKVTRNYNLSAPKGVRGRNSDNTLIKDVFNWEPNISLQSGIAQTYEWIYNQLLAKLDSKENSENAKAAV